MTRIARGAVIALAIGILGPTGASGQESEWVARAEALIRDIEAGRYAEAAAKMAPEVRAQLDSARLAQVWGQITAAAGSLETLTERTDTVQSEMHLVEFDAGFERQPLLVRVVMLADGQVAGLWFLPPGGEGAARREGGTEGPQYADPSRIEEVEVTVGSAPWELAGTLTLPAGTSGVPAVVLVHGSGPHDRDETIGPNKPFRDLAHGLAGRGVAVLRYEKRTKVHGARMAGSVITVDDEVIDDAVAALAAARAHPRVKGVFVAGHSLGGMLAPEIAVRDGEVAGVILLAGAARGLAEMMAEQIEYIASLPESAVPAVQAQLLAVLDTVALLRDGELADSAVVMGAPASYVYDLDRRDPLGMVKRVASPVLVLQGGRDYQVTEVDLGRWREALSGRTDAAFRLYADLNHLFMEGTGKATPREYARAGHVAEKVMADMATWVKEGLLPSR